MSNLEFGLWGRGKGGWLMAWGDGGLHDADGEGGDGHDDISTVTIIMQSLFSDFNQCWSILKFRQTQLLSVALLQQQITLDQDSDRFHWNYHKNKSAF